MSHQPAGSWEYLKNAVLTASPEQLQLMLLDGAVRYAQRGLDALRANQPAAMFDAFDRAQRIVVELSNGIRREVNPTLGDRMTGLYGFIFRRLVDANLHRNAQAVEDALRILRHQRETWALLIEKLKSDTAPPLTEPPVTAAATADENRSVFMAEA